MKSDACCLCGGKNNELLFRDGKYRVYQCNNCSFIEVFPKPPADELIKIYNKEYFRSDEARSYGYLDYLKDKENYLSTFRKRFDILDKTIHFDINKKILEIGAAYGFFLSVLEERGFKNLTGTEIAEEAANSARSRLKHSKMVLGQIKDIHEKFDYIFLWEVIEHVYDPKEMIEKCDNLLNPNGYLIIETQNVKSLAARILGKKWWHYKHKEHIYHFNKKTLRILVNKFKVISISSKGAGKYISKEFAVERLIRIHPFLSRFLKYIPFPKRIYANFYDEVILICKKKSGEIKY